MMIASFANSLGCSGGIGPPIVIQRVAPLRSTPMPGMSTANSPTIAASMSSGLSQRSRR